MGQYGGQFVFSHVCLDVAAVRPTEGLSEGDLLDVAQKPMGPGDPWGEGWFGCAASAKSAGVGGIRAGVE